MIKGNAKEERRIIETPDVKYREIQALNYSGLKLFDSNPMQFYKEYVLGEKRKEKLTGAILIGQLVDFFLLDCRGDEDEFNQRFDEQFSLFEGVKSTAQAFILADYIYGIREQNPQSSYISCFEEAFSRIQAEGKYKGKTQEWALNDFEESPASPYLQKRLESAGKYTVDNFQLEKAKSIVYQLLTDEFTKDIYSPDSNLELFTKFPIEWKCCLPFNEEVDCKSEIDLMLIDHKGKFIYIKDNKCTYDNEEFEYSYLKHAYYLQNSFYWSAVCTWKNSNEMEDYRIIDGVEFIVADTSANNRRPLKYTTIYEHIEEGREGFTNRGQYYRGWKELMTEIVWCRREGIWNVGFKAYSNNGRLNLRTFNDK